MKTMKNIKIVSENKYINTFYCKKCKVAGKVVYKDDEESYCELCVPEELKSKCKIINQNREEI